MFTRTLPEDLPEQVVSGLGIMLLCDGNDIEARNILDAYNAISPSYGHKLSVVQFGDQFCGVDFDPEKSCWYNPENKYGCHSLYYEAALDAIAVRLHLLEPLGESLSRNRKVQK